MTPSRSANSTSAPPAIAASTKGSDDAPNAAAQRLARLSAPRHPDGGARLLFWPEAAVTEPLEDARTTEHRAFAEFERTRAASLLADALLRDMLTDLLPR